MRHITRRDVLRGAVGLTAGMCASRLLPWQLALAETIISPTVVVAEGSDDDTPEVLLRTALAPLGGIERFVKPGQTVVIKPNATWMNAPHTASSSDPDLLRAMINLVKAAGAARVIVVDRSVFDPPAALLEVSGLGPVLVETGAENMVLDRWEEPKSKYTMIEIPKGQAFQEIGVVKAAAEADVRINMAVAKTHIVLPVTLCCKHMMGFLENPPGLHASLDQGIADIVGAPAIKADLHILEAIRVRVRGAAYGDGTDITDPDRVKRKNQVIAGTDPVLIDAYAAGTYFGRSPMEITHIKRCFEAGLGEIDVNKALEAGQLRRFRPAEVLITPTPTAAPTPTTDAQMEGTPAPRPTAQATAAPAPTPLPKPRTLGDSIMDLNPIVNAPLVPLAMVIGGVGMVVGRRLARQLPRAGEESAADKPPVEPGDDR